VTVNREIWRKDAHVQAEDDEKKIFWGPTWR
jgi:hypothetical protein